MSRTIRGLVSFALIVCIFLAVHEAMHVFFAKIYGEYAGIRVVWLGRMPFGIEVLMQTPVRDASGLKWFLISGMSNFVTLFIGYALFLCRRRLSGTTNIFVKAVFFRATLLFMLLDALNLSIGPFIYGGDIQGIAAGLNLNQLILQMLFFVLFLLNRELIAQKVFPAYGASTRHPLFIPWFRHGSQGGKKRG